MSAWFASEGKQARAFALLVDAGLPLDKARELLNGIIDAFARPLCDVCGDTAMVWGEYQQQSVSPTSWFGVTAKPCPNGCAVTLSYSTPPSLTGTH